MTAPECFRCGAPATERFGSGHLCDGFVPDRVEGATPDSHDAGYGNLVPDGLRGLDDWLTWTPGGRETPLYAFTPDLGR